MLRGKVGRVASEEVVLHLVTRKCIPVNSYVLEVWSLSKYEGRTALNRLCCYSFADEVI